MFACVGVVALTSESSAAARDRHLGAAKPRWHHAQTGHGAHGFTHGLGRRLAHRAIHQVAEHPAKQGVHHIGQDGARTAAPEGGHGFSGIASYYAEGQHVASGATFNPSGYSCAHRTLPFGTHLRVADPRTGRSVVVTVNDRGPFVHGRVLDLSLGAARALGMTGRGVMRISASVI